MALIKKIFTTLFLITLPLLFYGQKDSLKTKRLAIYVSPSQILFGDVPIGIEHSLTKRISHELFIQFKVTGPILNLYNFDQGFGCKYFFKYNLLKSKKTFLHLNLGYNYRNIFFANKQETTPIYNALTEIQPKFNASLRKINNSLVTGLSFESKLFKQFYYGANLFFEYGQYKNIYNINDPKFERYYNQDVPYNLEEKSNYYSINFVIKIGYEIF